MTDLFARLEDEAAIAARPGQHDRLLAIAAEVADVVAERDRLRRGGAELGKSLLFWMELARDVTGSDDVIEDDGDGDWGVVAERLAEMRAQKHEPSRGAR